VHQLDFKVMNVIDARCNHEVSIMRSFTVCTSQQILTGWSKEGGWDGKCTYGGEETHIQGFGCDSSRKKATL